MRDGAALDYRLWSRILCEAEEAINGEPVLAPLIVDSVIKRASLADAICNRLASLLAQQGERPQFLTAIGLLAAEDRSILASACADIMAVLDRDPATAKALHVLLHVKGFLALQAHRFAHGFWHAGRRELALHLQGSTSRVLQVDVHPAARLGAGIFLDHATGIVIGETCIIEDDVSILQNVTLGGTGKESGERHPKVRRGVLLGAGAIVLGNIEIGACARIGAGSVVLKPVEAGKTVAGVPARVLGANFAQPSRSMDQVFDVRRPSYDVGL